MNDNQHIVTALVSNKSGVLNRVAGLFSKRGYNIESLSVASTEDNQYSRMTIVVNGDDYVLDQITKQLDKLIDVRHVTQLDGSKSIIRELLLIKIKVMPSQRAEIEATARMYKAKVVDLSPESMTLELTGEGSKLDGFFAVLQTYGIIEMARTGLTALARGEHNIKDFKDTSEVV